jgi:hypothetical protein
MKANYVIYDNNTGTVAMILQTDDPNLVKLNTPEGCKTILTDTTDILGISKVDPIKKKIIPSGKSSLT